MPYRPTGRLPGRPTKRTPGNEALRRLYALGLLRMDNDGAYCILLAGTETEPARSVLLSDLVGITPRGIAEVAREDELTERSRLEFEERLAQADERFAVSA